MSEIKGRQTIIHDIDIAISCEIGFFFSLELSTIC